MSAVDRGRGAASRGLGLRPLPGLDGARIRGGRLGSVRDPDDRLAHAGRRRHLSELRAGPAPRCRRRGGNRLTRGGLPTLPRAARSHLLPDGLAPGALADGRYGVRTYLTIRSFPLSATYTCPWPSTAMSCGARSCPVPEPGLPHLLRSTPL